MLNSCLLGRVMPSLARSLSVEGRGSCKQAEAPINAEGEGWLTKKGTGVVTVLPAILESLFR